MKTRKYIVGIALLAIWAMPSFSQVSNDNEDGVNKIDSRWAQKDYVPGQVLVKFKDSQRVSVRRAGGRFASTNDSRLTSVLQKYGVDEMEQLLPNEKPHRQLRRAKAFNGEEIQERDLSQLYRLQLDEAHTQDVESMIETLKELDEVEYAEPNYYCYIMGGECIAESYGGNPLSNQQWYLDAYGVTELWDKPIINSERPVIAIIDTGVDTTHPDLKDNCIEGYDFIHNTTQVVDDNMHGTHVAGIAAACNNETGIIGANPQALIMPIKVLDKNGQGNTATILQGVNYAVQHGAKILNLSLGGYGYSKAAADVYRNASLSAIIVAAAGNDGKCLYTSHEGSIGHGILPQPSFPGAYSFVLGVQATNRKGELASFSNYDDDGPLFSCESSLNEPDGFNYELKAPGTEIYSTLPNGNYGELQGTSMASPLVAGAISALMMVKNYDSQEQLWAELLHTNNIAEAFELTELPADLKVVRIMLRERKDFSDETEDAYIGNNEVKAGEEINIYPVIRCSSGEASNIKMKLEVDENEDPNCVQIMTGEVDFGWHLDAMGKAVSQNPLTFKVPTDIADSRHIRLRIAVSCENQEGISYRSFTFVANNMETISGILSENTTFYDGHVYYIDDDLIVMKDVTLTIQPGARLEFAQGKSLMSNGKLVAKGTPEKPIVFTSHHGGETWGGLMTRKKSGQVIESGLYTNSDQTLFTLLKTDATPIFMSTGWSVSGYCDPSLYAYKSFYLSNYMRNWSVDDTLLKNVRGDESLLTDPDFLTPMVLQMRDDFNDYLEQSDFGERSETRTRYLSVSVGLLSWSTYSDNGDTIAYCRIEDCKGRIDQKYDIPYKQECMITDGGLGGHVRVYRCVTDRSGMSRYSNIVNGSGVGERYSDYVECNLLKGDGYWLSISTLEPEIDHSKHPSYLGTSREDIVRQHIYELGNPPNNYTLGVIDLSNMRTTPVAEAHGIVWKVLVDGKDAQDEYEEMPPLGVGKHKFEVYYNRPMNKAVAPQISFGVRDPWTQNPVDEDASWNAEGTIYTAYKTITGKTMSDGENRIYVRGGEDDEYFPCPYEKSRFNVMVQAAGSMATGFAAEPLVGRISLTWDNSQNDMEDAMGYNVYRYSSDKTKTIPGHYDYSNGTVWIPAYEVPDTIRINQDILSAETSEYVDYDVKPGQTYYYMYKVLNTDLKEFDLSNIVAATPMTATMGDANGSGDVDVADVVTTVNYMMGMNPSPFLFDAADVNVDKSVDILDVVGIVQKVLHPSSVSQSAVAAEAQAVYSIENGVLYVESPVALAGVQVQLTLEGRIQKDVTTAADLEGFEQASAWLTDEDYTMIGYSFGGKMLSAGKHALLYIGDGELTTLRLADAVGNRVKVTNGNATDISTAVTSRGLRSHSIYNLNGQKVAGGEDSMKALKKGVYITNGRKVVK